MTTIKSYTDLSQSKTLSKILKPESADFCYYKTGVTDNWMGVPEYQFEPMPHKDYSGESIGCWSLAAILELMPNTIQDEDGVMFGLNIKKNFVEYYNPSMGALYATYHCITAENIVDAAFDMICWLKENGKL